MSFVVGRRHMRNGGRRDYVRELLRREVAGNFRDPFVRRSSRSKSENPVLESNGFPIF